MFKCFIYTGGKKLLNATTSYNKCRSAIFKKQNSILAQAVVFNFSRKRGAIIARRRKEKENEILKSNDARRVKIRYTG